MNTPLLHGLHHVTATTENTVADYQFYQGILGFRLVKKTINFEDARAYHLYYGDVKGNPGTLMTTFPYEGLGVRRHEIGTGMTTTTAFSIPIGSLDFWKNRLSTFNVDFSESSAFLSDGLVFQDPSGLSLALVEADATHSTPWSTEDIPSEKAIQGLFGATIWVKDLDESVDFLVEELGFEVIFGNGLEARLVLPNKGVGSFLNLVERSNEGRAKQGMGAVHHLAWQVANKKALHEIRERLTQELGMRVTEVKDRKYFQSIYFRIPGGVLFELATLDPGFSVDEPTDQLGQHLQLPLEKEEDRHAIEAALPSLIG